MVFDSVVTDGDRVLARGQVVGVCVSAETGRPAEVPGSQRELLAAYGV
jgi:acyl-CoA thioesterase FadM